MGLLAVALFSLIVVALILGANTINQIQYTSDFTMSEQITTSAPALGVGGNSVISTGFNVQDTLTPTSTPPASLGSYENYALVAGTLSIDLTALVGTGGGAVNTTGKKVCLLKYQNTGSHVQTIASGASNGWESGGVAWSMTLQPGEEMGLLLGNTNDVAVGSTNKVITVTGTGTDTFNLAVNAG